MFIKYHICLSGNERTMLTALVKQEKPKVAQYKKRHAQIILAIDENNSPLTHEKVCRAFNVSPQAVCHLRQRFVEEGIDVAINCKWSHLGRARKLDGEQEAHLVALVCSEPPEGRARWTLNLLRDQMVILSYVGSVSRSTIQRTLKKTNLNLG